MQHGKHDGEFVIIDNGSHHGVKKGKLMFIRKNVMLLAAFFLAAVLITGCGKGEEGSNAGQSALPSSSAAESPSPSESAQSADPSGTRIYKDALGREVEIPTHPERIITSQYLPQMIALGIKPIGAATHLLTGFDAIKDQIGGIEDVGPANELNIEKALTLQPDLILVAEWNKDSVEQLSKIAPTVVVQWADKDPFGHLREVADVLGKTDEAEQWIQAYEKKSEEARSKLAGHVADGETFGVVVIGGYENRQLRVYGSGNVGYTLFETLGLSMTDRVKAAWEKGDNGQGLAISLEQLPELASADRLFLVTFHNDEDFVKEVEQSKLWANLPAVKNDKVYTVDDGLWFSYDVMSFAAQLDDAVRLLTR